MQRVRKMQVNNIYTYKIFMIILLLNCLLVYFLICDCDDDDDCCCCPVGDLITRSCPVGGISLDDNDELFTSPR